MIADNFVFKDGFVNMLLDPPEDEHPPEEIDPDSFQTTDNSPVICIISKNHGHPRDDQNVTRTISRSMLDSFEETYPTQPLYKRKSQIITDPRFPLSILKKVPLLERKTFL